MHMLRTSYLRKFIEEIYHFSLTVKEYQIIHFFLPKLKDELMKTMPAQKQTCACLRTRIRVFVAIDDLNGHVGLGLKCAKEVATAIILARLSLIPVRRGYWGTTSVSPMPCPPSCRGLLHATPAN
ncbi:hypothetical protein L226DRAFT_525115 [Lentinus tigrinus ALCF2SS1-7]|uniref:uncharacterized protein n=1 Tax=Lentinus tigrinus ALCF2SS1-7 TaxID=1328758 RepID=UPI0011661189|nr:hypothetical protein L226DRAFT_525115 [Lentinus tigrinus ALCF2SS1-7]